MRTIKRVFFVVAFVVVVGAVPFSSARAGSSVVGSTVCVRSDVIGAAGSGLTYTSVGVENDSGSDAEVICTLFRDNTSNTNGMTDLELAIGMSSNSTAGGTFTCQALSIDRKGIVKKQVTKQVSVASGGNTVIGWGSSLNVSVPKGAYAIECSVPIFGIIHSVFYSEP